MLRKIYFLLMRIYTRSSNRDCMIEANVSLHGDIKFGRHTRVSENAKFFHSQIGDMSYVGPNSKIYNTSIGKFTSIGPNCIIVEGRHPSKTFVSTHPAFFSLKKQCGVTFVKEQKFEEVRKIEGFSVIIGNDVWIGESVKIADGVTIGDGAIIGTSSLVVKDIEPYSINVGIPAKKTAYRFEEKYREWLSRFKWWEKDIEWIQEHAEEFDDIEKVYRRYQEHVDG